MGVPFLVAGVAAGIMSGNRPVMIPLGFLFAGILGFVMGPQAGIMTVLCSATLALCLRKRAGTTRTIALAAAVTVLGASLPADPDPVFMNLHLDDMEPLTRLYADMGVEPALIGEVFSTMEYLSPGMGAVQISLGCIAAVLFLRVMKRDCFGPSVRFALRWETAWVLIACLLARVFSDALPPVAARMADNVLLFMALPYLIEGGAVVLRWAASFPGMAVVLTVALLLATPFMLGAVALTGVLDTWFDFRRRIDMKVERLDK